MRFFSFPISMPTDIVIVQALFKQIFLRKAVTQKTFWHSYSHNLPISSPVMFPEFSRYAVKVTTEAGKTFPQYIDLCIICSCGCHKLFFS